MSSRCKLIDVNDTLDRTPPGAGNRAPVHRLRHEQRPESRTGAPVARDAGVSVLEVIIVVLIVGLLASVVVVAVGGLRADAADTGCAADRRALAVAVESFAAEHGTGPIPATGTDHDRFELTLVDVGLLRAASSTHDIDAEGVIRAEGTSPC